MKGHARNLMLLDLYTKHLLVSLCLFMEPEYKKWDEQGESNHVVILTVEGLLYNRGFWDI